MAQLPEPAFEEEDQVRIRMLEVGVCGTDREITQFEYGTPPEGSEFLVLGHEALGEVIETGPRVSHVKPGDLVVPSVRRPCGDPNCRACAEGHQDFCFTGKFKERGIHQLHGFMTEQIVERGRYVHRVPPELRRTGVLIEPLTIATKALRQIREIQDRLPWTCRRSEREDGEFSCRRALVLGAGPVGLLGAMVLANAGFETMVYSRASGIAERQQITNAIGAEFIPAEAVRAAELEARIGEVDVVYEAVGASQLAFETLELLGHNALFIFTGVPGRKTKVTINTDVIMRNMVLKNQVLIGTVNAASEDFESAIVALSEFERRWPGVTEQLKSQAFPLDQVPEILKSKHGIKNYVTFADGR